MTKDALMKEINKMALSQPQRIHSRQYYYLFFKKITTKFLLFKNYIYKKYNITKITNRITTKYKYKNILKFISLKLFETHTSLILFTNKTLIQTNIG